MRWAHKTYCIDHSLVQGCQPPCKNHKQIQKTCSICFHLILSHPGVIVLFPEGTPLLSKRPLFTCQNACRRQHRGTVAPRYIGCSTTRSASDADERGQRRGTELKAGNHVVCKVVLHWPLRVCARHRSGVSLCRVVCKKNTQTLVYLL